MLFEVLFFSAGVLYIAGKGLNSAANRTVEQQYVKQLGFNHERQRQLERMVCSPDPEERKAFDRMVRRTVDRTKWWDEQLAVREISIREGWK